MVKEIWRVIEISNGLYHVSNLGNVRSVPHSVFGVGKNKWQTRKGKVLKLETTIDGYYRATMSIDGKSKRVLVHRLVAIAFIDNPKNKPFINHINGIRNDNRVENLEWCTNSENVIHSIKLNGYKQHGDNSSRAKLNSKQVKEIFKSSGSSAEVALKYKISAKTIRDIRVGKSWSRVTGKIYNKKN